MVVIKVLRESTKTHLWFVCKDNKNGAFPKPYLNRALSPQLSPMHFFFRSLPSLCSFPIFNSFLQLKQTLETNPLPLSSLTLVKLAPFFDIIYNNMSGRSRSRQSSAIRISDEQITDLVHKLQQLLPEIRNRHSDKVCTSVSMVLERDSRQTHYDFFSSSFVGFRCKGIARDMQLHSKFTQRSRRSE